LNTVVTSVVFYFIVFGLFLCADVLARNNAACRNFHASAKTKNPFLTALFCVLSVSGTLLLIHFLVKAGIPSEYFIAVPFFLILYEFGRKVLEPRKYSEIGGLVFSCAVTFLWLFCSNWLVLNVVALLLALPVLAIMSKLTFKQCFLLSFAIVAYDIVSVFGSGIMQEVAVNAENTPAFLSVPTEFINGPNMIGLGDIVLPGLTVMLAFRKARDCALPFLGYASFAGYVIGSIAAGIVCVYFNVAQPATLYLVPAVIGAFILTAHFYGISFSALWNDKT
jgi:presenilin-like A22 family membrane protease